jgi:hypothetical protein
MDSISRLSWIAEFWLRQSDQRKTAPTSAIRPKPFPGSILQQGARRSIAPAPAGRSWKCGNFLTIVLEANDE